MIKLDNFEENFKNEDTTEIKRKEFLKLYEVYYKKINPDIDLNNQLYFSNAVHNDKEFFERYAILNKQLIINSVLQNIMDTVNSYFDEKKVTPLNRVRINSVVTDINKLNDDLLKKGIDTSGFQLELFSLDEIRSYLYDSVNIKHRSISDMYDMQINEGFGYLNVDYSELIVQGINPYYITNQNEKAYIDEDYLRKNNLLEDYIIKGKIFGKDVLSKDNKKRK